MIQKPRVWPIFLAGYVVLVTIAFGLLNGDQQWRCRNDWTHICDQYMARDLWGFSMAFSVFPIGWSAAIFGTAFGQHGFAYGTTPAYTR